MDVVVALLVMIKARTLGIPCSGLDLAKVTPEWVTRAQETLMMDVIQGTLRS